MAGRLRTREWSGIDYYAELGVATDASRPAIDEAFRRLAKTLHPDRNPDAAAEERFKHLTVAYEVLRDPVTRRAYDEFRYQVAAGLLYRTGSGSRPAPSPSASRPGPAAAPAARTPSAAVRRRHQLPDGVRVALGVLMLVGALAAALWAVLGDLPAHTVGDTALGVQITLAIIALKLAGCGVVTIKYPELRARWHRP